MNRRLRLRLRTLLLLGALASPMAAQATQVRVSFKRVLGPGGAPSSTWALDHQVNATFNIARSILLQANVDLSFTGTEDWLDPQYPSSWFDVDLGGAGAPDKTLLEQAAESEPDAYRWRTDAINVYLVNSLVNPPVAGFCSFPTPTALPNNDDLILLGPNVVNGNSLGFVLAHEIGHYLGLFHTFQTTFGVEGPSAGCAPAANCQTTGDLVCDTLPDPNNLAQLAVLYPPATCPATFSNLANNVMSLYPGIQDANAIFTPGQAVPMAAALAGPRAHVVVGNPTPSITAATLSSPTRITVSGSALPLTAPGANVTVALAQEVLCNLGGPPLSCGPEAFSLPVTSGGPTSIVADFATTLPNGEHTVGLFVGGDLVAFLPKALQVGPVVRDMPITTGGLSVMRFASSAGGAATMIAAVGSEIAPTPLPGVTGLLHVTPILTVFPVTTSAATGAFEQPYFLFNLPPATPFVVQALEVETNRLSSFARIVAP